MDKKLFGSIIIVSILLSVLGVIAMSPPGTVNDITMKTNNSYVVNWSSSYSAGGSKMVVNFTLSPNFTLSNTATQYTHNISSITISLSPLNKFKLSFMPTGATNDTGIRSPGGATNNTKLSCQKVDSATNATIQCRYSPNSGASSDIPGNATIYLVFYLNQTTSTNDEKYDNAWTITVNTNSTSVTNTQTRYFGVDDLAPRIKSFNISDGVKSLTSRDGNFNGTDNLGYFNSTDLNVSILLTEYNRENLTIFWTWNGTTVAASNATYGISFDGTNKVGIMSTGCLTEDTDTQECLYSFNIKAGNFTSGSTYSIRLWANDSFNQQSNFTNGGIGYNFTIDGSIPSGNIVLEKTTYFAADNIKIKCEASDSISSPTATIKITKPSSKIITKLVGANDAFTYIFKNTDTNEAGKYLVDCTIEDQGGNKIDLTQTSFRAFFSDTSSGGEEGEVAPVAKTDIASVESGIISGKQGESKTFTIDGTTAHSIEFMEVTLTSVKMKIQSEPVEITLDIGKSMNVDVDGDGANDIKVTLNSIEDGLAKVEVINLAKVEEREEGLTPEIPEVTEQGSKLGVWITVLVIIIVIGVGYYLLKSKKSKRGEVKFSKQDLGL